MYISDKEVLPSSVPVSDHVVTGNVVPGLKPHLRPLVRDPGTA